MEEDSSGYPDCKAEFFKSFNEMISKGTKPGSKINVVTPLISFNKKQVVENSIKLNAPIHLSWSCYTETQIACGECDSCALRLRGFQLAGVNDPLRYKKNPNYV